MGLFVSRSVDPAPVEEELVSAFTAGQMNEAEARQRAALRAAAVATRAASGTVQVHVGRIVGAFVLFGILLAVAVLADHFKWVSDPKYLYGFASTVLGIVVGFLGGETAGANPSS